MAEYTIANITEEEDRTAYDFLDRCFFLDEPLTSTMDVKPGVDECICIRGLEQHLSLKALDTSGNFVGLCVCMETSKHRPPEHVSENMTKLLEFFHHCETLFHMEDTSGETATLQVVAVEPSWRRRGVCRGMVEKAADLCRSRGYRRMDTICTSLYTARLMERLGWKRLGAVRYREYTGPDGRPVFAPAQPHTEAVAYSTDL